MTALPSSETTQGGPISPVKYVSPVQDAIKIIEWNWNSRLTTLTVHSADNNLAELVINRYITARPVRNGFV